MIRMIQQKILEIYLHVEIVHTAYRDKTIHLKTIMPVSSIMCASFKLMVRASFARIASNLLLL